jgi:quercetin dioxygenase-like cupin family protein
MKKTNRVPYQKRATFLESISSTDKAGYRQPLLLNKLVAAMKKAARFDASMSSLYFAGAIGDHPYFLKNDKFALGIAVMPEDREKAGVCKRHPHQQEFIIVLDGEIRVKVMSGKGYHDHIVQSGESIVIGKGKGHSVFPVNDKKAVYLFLKSNPAIEPREEVCERPGMD